MWEPKTFEDQLLKRYLDDNPGKLYLEVSVSFMTELNKARRIDGVLFPGEETTVYPQGAPILSVNSGKISKVPFHLGTQGVIYNRPFVFP